MLLSLLNDSGKECVKEGMKLKNGSTLLDEKESSPVGTEIPALRVVFGLDSDAFNSRTFVLNS